MTRARESLGRVAAAVMRVENACVHDEDRELFRDRRRAESFGSAAELYDATRPSYPNELIEWLSSTATGRAVDVGCGTGRVARLLAVAGWRVVGVEADERMAAVARSHGLDVVVSRFEDWRPEDHFDLVCAGQAWHWIDPQVGYEHAAEVLRPGGHLAVFWNTYHYSPATMAVFTAVLEERAPHLLIDSVPFGTAKPDHSDLDAEMVRSAERWFEEPEFRVFHHGRVQSVEDWLAESVTHSPVAMLDDDTRSAVLADLRVALTEHVGGQIDVRYETRVTSARRR